ncbi:MAG: FAD:protein FMN transferase [Variovorax sp.]|nr:MAG: FAD:protein FMN transferase [Variovorax sp.]
MLPSFAHRTTGYANSAAPRAADPATLQQLAGRTMGTTWSLRFDNPAMLPLVEVRTAVETALDEVVAQMSHWAPESALSRYNRAPGGSSHPLPPAFAAVLRCALEEADRSAGALDPTVGPLVRLWGFGPDAAPSDEAHVAPSAAEREATRARCGWEKLAFDADSATLFQPGGLTLDFSGIAKGFAVDHAVDALQALGLRDLLMEIGGELRVAGRRPGGMPWRVQVANAESDNDAAALTLPLHDMAIATSGDRWHQRTDGTRRWSHTIDPRTGEPVDHALAAVSVLHTECMRADALATVLTVLGPADGLAFAESHGIAALFNTRAPQGLRTHASTAWAALHPSSSPPPPRP